MPGIIILIQYVVRSSSNHVSRPVAAALVGPCKAEVNFHHQFPSSFRFKAQWLLGSGRTLIKTAVPGQGRRQFKIDRVPH
jgi:hypothetical protein